MRQPKSKDSTVSSLFSTVKKSKQVNQLQHAKSYDDIFAIPQLEPCEVKILLNNDRSLKSLKKGSQQHHRQPSCSKQPTFFKPQQNIIPNTTRQNSTSSLSQVLQQSIMKQNLLMKRQLFDPFKYFGTTTQLSSIQQSTSHHQSRLQAMFSQSNSPLATDHSASFRKKSPINTKKKINIDVNRISNSVLIAKLEKLDEHEKKVKGKLVNGQESFAGTQQGNRIKYSVKNSLIDDKQNHMLNSVTNHEESIHSTIKPQILKDTTINTNNMASKPPYHQPSTYQYSNHNTKKTTQNYEESSSIISSKKMSIQNQQQSRSYNRAKQVNCSPKSYVKDAKQKYLKMNLNSLQKVRLKLKLTSSKG